MNLILTLAIIIFCLPLFGFLVIGLWAKKMRRVAGLIGSSLLLITFLLALILLMLTIQNKVPSVITFPWIKSDSFFLDFGIRIDAISAIMLVVVTLVSFLVHLFSLDYMHGDSGIARYYAELQLFTASMIGVVMSVNLLQFFCFWELVGLCSYLLIGFWFHKPSAYRAAKKAFFVTKVGDVGFLIALILIFFHTNPHTLNLVLLQESWITSSLPPVIAFSTGLLLFCGVMGKSAQFPLHVWLPDAMEGPTPVSALIHAATMVAAGVYLAFRTLFLFTPNALVLMMFVGGFTAFFAATIAVVQYDIKKVLAYSTISQLGYMILALGSSKAGSEAMVSAGAIAGLFHLVTHAIFKGLLFLGSGSVIHATHTQDMREMGGLIRKLPITGATFIIGSLALAGIFPLAGFWSKDAILSSVLVSAEHQSVVWIPLLLAIMTAFLTPFYMTRCVWLTFFGSHRKENHAHEASYKTTLPLIILAVLSVLIGFIGSGILGFPLQKLLMGHFYETEPVNWTVMIGSSIIALLAIGVAYRLYGRKHIDRTILTKPLLPLIRFLKNKWYIDEAYTFLMIKPMFRVSNSSFWTDKHVIDGAVNGVAALGISGSSRLSWIDHHVVDRLINLIGNFQLSISRIVKWWDEKIIDQIVVGCAWVFGQMGKKVRLLQTGYLPNYSLIMFFSLFIILLTVALIFRF